MDYDDINSPARGHVVDAAERDGDDGAGQTDDVVGHGEVRGRQWDHQRLCVQADQETSRAVRQAAREKRSQSE